MSNKMKVSELAIYIAQIGDYYAGGEPSKQGKKYTFYKAAQTLLTNLGADTEVSADMDFTIYPGIGYGIQQRCMAIINREEVYELNNPPVANPIKWADQTTRELLKEFSIYTQDDVVRAMQDRRLCNVLPDSLIEANGRMRIEKVHGLLEELNKITRDGPCAGAAMVPLGSYRRNSPTIKDLDFIIVDCSLQSIIDAIRNQTEILVREVTTGDLMRRTVLAYKGLTIGTDFKKVPEGTEGSALLHFTGPASLNIASRGAVKSRGYSLNEYGLYKAGSDESVSTGLTESELIELLNKDFGTNINVDPTKR